MKKCNECKVEMIEETNLHTDFVGGVDFEERIYISYLDRTKKGKNIFGKETDRPYRATHRVKARLCPNCKKIELFAGEDDDKII